MKNSRQPHKQQYCSRHKKKPALSLLFAQSDEDPAAMIISVTPVDLSDNHTDCPLCGRRDGNSRR